MGGGATTSPVRLEVLGIRHHGPGSARSVLAALEELRPAVVLVELPADVGPVLRWVGHAELVPPVAVLGHVVSDPGRAVFAPLTAFSPEWCALAWANERGIATQAIDLPWSISLARRPADAHEQLDLEVAPGDVRGVDPLAELAHAAGDDDPERWWEDVVEHRGEGLAVFEAVAEAMAAVRAGVPTPRAEERREAHMRRAIRAAVRDLARTDGGTVVVVCGAWHVPALRSELPATVDAATLRGLTKEKVAVSWVPWTHRRLMSSAGYGAGVRSPGWYHHVFRHPGPDGVARFLAEAGRATRDAGLSASPDHLVAATRLADALAALRGRPRAGLDEVLDATDAVLGGAPLVERRLVVGDAIGGVPADAPQVPLARDLAALQRRTRLRPSAEPTEVELDLRTPAGRARSELLHRTVALGLGWGSVVDGRGSSGTFRETWRLVWEPEESVRLVELAAFGTSVESAATARLVERATGIGRPVELAAVLEVALLARLPDAVGPVVRALATCAATDPDVGDLMAALVPLADALRYGDVRGTDVSALRSVFDGMVARILAGLPTACASLDHDAAGVMVERLGRVQAALALIDHPARQERFPALLRGLATSTDGHGLVQGRASRLLHDAGAWPPGEVRARLGRALSGGTPPASGAAFVDGFLAGSGTVLVHDAPLRGLLDDWLATLPADAFAAVVPLLRRTFGAFEPAERRRLGALVAAGSSGRAGAAMVGADPGAEGDALDLVRAAAGLRTVRHLLGVPVHDDDLPSLRVLAGQTTVVPGASGASGAEVWGEVPAAGAASDPVTVAHGSDGDISSTGSTGSAPSAGSAGSAASTGLAGSTGSAASTGSTGSAGSTIASEAPWPVAGPGAGRVSEAERMRRWRLVLGGGEADGTGAPLSGDDVGIDRALGAVYDLAERTTRGRGGGRSGGLTRSAPSVARWLGDVRRYFPTPVVQVLQRDAVERLDLRQLLFEPELLESFEPDVHLVSLLVELNRVLPEETRATARLVVARVLADLEQRLADRTRVAVRGALARSSRTRRPRPADIDWPSTVKANLRHWLPEHRTVVPERLVGHGRRQVGIERDVIVAIDQSASMADSVVFASLFGSLLARLPALRTSVVVFDTEVTDLTSLVDDPIDVLFGVQLGGGTDIARALAYCTSLVTRPRETVVVLVSDLFEGGDVGSLLDRVRRLVHAGVTVLVLLALSDDGAPAHDQHIAAELVALGAVVTSCTPDAFPDLFAATLAR